MNTKLPFKIRNKNVQQQNQLMYLEIKQNAEKFRMQPTVFSWLVAALSLNSLAPTDGLLISCSSVPEQGGSQWMGIWLTKDEHFFEFDIMAEYTTGKLIAVDEWKEVKPKISAHQKGTGKTLGYLALQLLAEY